MHDEIYFRDKILELKDQLDTLDNPSEGSVSALVQTITETAYPTTPSSFFAVSPLLVDGAEREGVLASFTPDPARIFYAFNLGTGVPPVSTKLIVTSTGGRWTFRWDGDGS